MEYEILKPTNLLMIIKLDKLCFWLLSSEGNTGNFVFNFSLTCESYKNDSQCGNDIMI
jgi:hypothetical protein